MSTVGAGLTVSLRRRLALGLSREVWMVQAGLFLNMLGYGAVLPFEVIYLHDGRGFSLGAAGLVIGTLTGVAVVAAPVAGPLIDRFGARALAVGASLALAGGYAGLAFADSLPRAFAAAALAGTGNGALNPSQSTLITALTPSELRHRATAVSRVATNAGIGIGGALGGLVAARGLDGFIALFLANAVTSVGYVAVLVTVVPVTPRAAPAAGGYRLVLADRAFRRLALINVAVIGVGWGVFTWLVPAYARGVIGASTRAIGLLLLVNAVTVVVAQVPIARLSEGRRRMHMIAIAAGLFTAACLLVVLAGSLRAGAFVLLVTAAFGVALGECFHSAVLTPLVADLAPQALRGRYMATIGLSWWIGLAAAPTLGGQLMSRSATAALLASAAVAAGAAAAAVALEPRLPVRARRTPRVPTLRQRAGPVQEPRCRWRSTVD